MNTFILCLLVVSTVAAPSGRPQFKRGLNRIVGGTDVAPGELPYQVSFQHHAFGYSFHFCGGSVYSADTVICAGHCVHGEDYEHPEKLQIVAGDNNLRAEEGTEQTAEVVKIIIHEDFDTQTISNDISLLKLGSPLIFDSFIGAIPIPLQGESFNGSALVSGWGTLTEGGNTPTILQKVEVPIVSDDDCRESYGYSDVSDSMICAGEEGRDSCQGDSGGPMVCGGFLCGIVSWGHGCARPDYPGVYTEVSYFVDWILANA